MCLPENMLWLSRIYLVITTDYVFCDYHGLIFNYFPTIFCVCPVNILCLCCVYGIYTVFTVCLWNIWVLCLCCVYSFYHVFTVCLLHVIIVCSRLEVQIHVNWVKWMRQWGSRRSKHNVIEARNLRKSRFVIIRCDYCDQEITLVIVIVIIVLWWLCDN